MAVNAAKRLALDGFNEAALFRTRKGLGEYTLDRSPTSFNEAALFRTRKAGQPRRHLTTTLRFNEAALFRTRKAAPNDLAAHRCRASMRPRSFERGKCETWA